MKTLVGRLTLWLVGGVGATLLLVGLLIWTRVDAFLIDYFDDNLYTRVLSLGAAAQWDSDGMVSLPYETALYKDYEGPFERDVFQVVDLEGEELARSPTLGVGADITLDPERIQQAWASNSAVTADLELPGGSSGRAVAMVLEVADPEGEPRRALFIVATPRLMLSQAQKSLFVPLSLGALAALIGLGVWVRAVVRRGLRPLEDIADRLGDLDEDTLERRLPVVDLPGELRPIAGQANALFDRLDAAFERERRTTNNIAHELRTPIAELRGLTEVALRLGDDPEFAAKTVAEAYAIATEMDRIATTLLRVARAQAGELEVKREVLSSSAVLERAIRSVGESARGRGIEFELKLRDDLELAADPDLLDLILINLLSNSIQHAPAGDRVTCEVWRGQDDVQFVIENTNPGLEPGDMKHLTETFWKKDDARTDAVHTGLGLALVDQLAQTCGYSFSMALAGDRVRARVTVPLD
ncbi:ATP-binding protein [Engelhardtia mirabilis]|uniref:histidine kinase n=1 Tax=Engelhardtia mirabilis TaxID=2528011 RepID=A0A518BHX8_9BACT|nr:Sensor kinase CusS [Planctomycetes bacterium Pla133]QDV00891.1 Sensor kinase CusS [Planctomycetes bacterium Pla86]